MAAKASGTSISTTIQQLAARWEGADRCLLSQIFPLLAEGQPVRVEQIVEITGAPPSRIKEALAFAHAGRDSQGRVIELSGLTLSPTFHRIEVGGVTLFSCCALLAHLTPFLLAGAVRLESVDPQTRGLVSLELTPATIAAHEPATALGSFVITEPHAIASDVGSNFCSHVHHFSNRESAKAFVATDPRRYIVELSQLHAAAGELYRETWG